MKKATAQKKCFLLMPFSEPFNRYYEYVYEPAVIEAGFVPFRADEIFGARPFMEDILESIKDADVVLAEVTGRNPNVMYEMGFAYAWAKPMIIVSQSVEDAPFDLRHHRLVIYDTTRPDWGARLRSEITQTILEVTQNTSKRSRPKKTER